MVALDVKAAGIEPAISDRKSNARTTLPPNYRAWERNGQVGQLPKRLWDWYSLYILPYHCVNCVLQTDSVAATR